MRVTIFCVLAVAVGCGGGTVAEVTGTGGAAGALSGSTGGAAGMAAGTGGAAGSGGQPALDAGRDAPMASCANLVASTFSAVASGGEVLISSAVSTCRPSQGTVTVTNGAVTYNGASWTLVNFSSTDTSPPGLCNVELQFSSATPIGTCGTETMLLSLQVPPG